MSAERMTDAEQREYASMIRRVADPSPPWLVIVAIILGLMALMLGCGPAPHMPQRGTVLCRHQSRNAIGLPTYQIYVEHKRHDGSLEVIEIDVSQDVWNGAKAGDEILY